MGLVAIAVTTTERDPTGGIAKGTVDFELTHRIRDATNNIVVEPVVITRAINGSGNLSPALNLYATNSPDIDPPPEILRYKVTRRFAGMKPRVTYVAIPYTAAGGTIDLASLEAATLPPVDTGALRGVNLPIPDDQGLLAWNFDPALATTSTAGATGVVYLNRIPIRQALTVAKIWIYVVTAGSNLVTSGNFLGLYSPSGQRLAVSPDQTTPWASAGVKSTTLAAPVAVSPPFVWVAVLARFNVLGAAPAILSGVLAPFDSSNIGLAVSEKRSAQLPSTFTTLPTSFTPSTLIDGGKPWVGLS